MWTKINMNMDNSEEMSTFVQNVTKMSKPVPKIDESRLKNNPFTESLNIFVTERIDTKITVKDEAGNDVPNVVTMEYTKATKVFHNPGAGDDALSLSAGGMRLYIYIIHKMESAQDWIRITPENYAIKTKASSLKTYKRDVDELIDAKYICMSPFKHVYYINPSRIFCGSRLLKYPEKQVLKGSYKGTDSKNKDFRADDEWVKKNEPNSTMTEQEEFEMENNIGK